MKKIKKKKKNIKLVFLLLIIFIISLIVFSIIFKKDNKYSDKIFGKWTTDEVTVYKFNDDNTGELILPLSKYKFNYEIKKDSLFIDFEDSKSEDINYTYTIKDNKLYLKGKNGEFKFKKMID